MEGGGSSKLGFQIKNIPKRQKIVRDEDAQMVPEKELILSVEDSVIASIAPRQEDTPLVIPLQAPLRMNTLVEVSSKTEILEKLKLKSANKVSDKPTILTAPAISTSATAATSKDLDALAAEELMTELYSKGTVKDSGLVIGVSSSGATTTAAAAAINTKNSNNGGPTASGVAKKMKSMPLLMANVAPELQNIENDDERFKTDVSLRAADMNFRSEAYNAVPVEQFGAALLRGMGWQGPTAESEAFQKEQQEKLSVRSRGLGLGATPKPIEMSNNKYKGNNPKKPPVPSSSSSNSNSNSNIHNNKGASVAATATPTATTGLKGRRRLQDGDIVWLRVSPPPTTETAAAAEIESAKLHDAANTTSASSTRSRACVIAVAGVPGLDRIRVQLESTGTLLEVPKTEVVLVDDEELKEKPYVKPLIESSSKKKKKNSGSSSSNAAEITADDGTASRDKQISLDRKDEQQQQQQDRRQGDRVESQKKRESESSMSGLGGKRSINGDHKLESGSHSDTRQRASASANASSSSSSSEIIKSKQSQHHQQKQEEPSWVRPNIRVKIISASAAGSKYYLQKGYIVDVTGPRVTSVRLDSNGAVLDGVKQRHLETVLPKVGGLCVVLSGEHAGESALLLERHEDVQTVAVQLVEDLDVVVMSMDNVAAAAVSHKY